MTKISLKQPQLVFQPHPRDYCVYTVLDLLGEAPLDLFSGYFAQTDSRPCFGVLVSLAGSATCGLAFAFIFGWVFRARPFQALSLYYLLIN